MRKKAKVPTFGWWEREDLISGESDGAMEISTFWTANLAPDATEDGCDSGRRPLSDASSAIVLYWAHLARRSARTGPRCDLWFVSIIIRVGPDESGDASAANSHIIRSAK